VLLEVLGPNQTTMNTNIAIAVRPRKVRGYKSFICHVSSSSYSPWWDLANGGAPVPVICHGGTSPEAVTPAPVICHGGTSPSAVTSYLPWWDLAIGGNQLQLFAMVGPRQGR
jgi:hypothetical protein